MLGTILIVILIIALLGAFPRWPHSRYLGILPKQRSWTDSLDFRCSSGSCPDLNVKGGYDVAF
jgi:hypothetical protein